MSEADRIKAILDAIDLLFKAKDEVLSRGKTRFFYALSRRWYKDWQRLNRAQFHLLNQLEMGGWNCFRD